MGIYKTEKKRKENLKCYFKLYVDIGTLKQILYILFDLISILLYLNDTLFLFLTVTTAMAELPARHTCLRPIIYVNVSNKIVLRMVYLKLHIIQS